MKEWEYPFDENTPPKEIIMHSMAKVWEIMQEDGFKFLKSKSEITKRTQNFVFSLYFQKNRYNMRGNSVEVIIHCTILDRKDNRCFWERTLAISNSKCHQYNWWELYDKKNYQKSMNEISKIITSKILPFFRKFENITPDFIEEVAKNGFCPFEGKQVYDAGYDIPFRFLEKYGTKEQLTQAFQNYIDRHELDYVKLNMKKAIELLKNNEEVKNNGEKDYAKYIVNNGLELKF